MTDATPETNAPLQSSPLLEGERIAFTGTLASMTHRQAMDLGVRAYLTKPCPDEVLITTLQRVLRESQ